MKVGDPSLFNKVGKLLALPLSFIVANSVTANFTNLFEPQPACQKKILDLNLPNSILIPKAVSSKTTKGELYSDSSTTSSLASLHQRQESNFKKHKFTSFAVDTITIDEIISEYNLEDIDFIKIDIEGHELEALKGAAKSLASGMIKALAFEFGSGNLNSRTFFRDFWNLLSPLG